MSLRQLKVILWKNLIIRKRHWFLLLCEALIPVALFLLVAYGRSKITNLSKQDIVNVTYNEKYRLSYDDFGFNGDTHVYFSPSDNYYDDIIHRVQEKFQIINNNIKGFNSRESLLETYARTSNNTVIAIIFNPASKATLDYTIRYHKQYFSWKTEQLYENALLFQPGTGSKYQWEGFLALQMALDMSFIEKEKESRGERMPKVVLDTLEFPYPPHKADSGLSQIFIHFYPLITLFSFIFVCPAVLKRVVEEKHTGIKELMKMVGMKPSLLWFGWFIYSLLPMILSVCLITFILKVDLFSAGYPPIEYSNAGVLVVFLTLYCMASIVVCFFLSSIFYKPTLATLVGLLMWILSYFVPKYIIEDSESNESRVSFGTNILLMIFPNMALHYGYSAMAKYEEREIGLQWSNWHLPGGGGSNEISMLQVCLMLIFDCAFYMLIALYIDNIRPGKYGTPKPYLYPLVYLRSLWKNRGTKITNSPESMGLKGKRGSTKGIELRNVTKKYGPRTVVDGLNMDIDKNRITVLLGHNGAGKSTTMGMITGMITKTSGSILVDGKEIRSSSDITDSIGLCPQHNLFFSDLTVAEHLKFFAMLKGRTCAEAENDVRNLLKPLNLVEKKNVLAHSLSGGMKRKLCLGMAVVGGSKILVLDEPSSGIDIESRRHMWNLLLEWRNERTILITTHFMEEADALADYIFIMEEGTMKDRGTPFDLKKKYDTGYNLSFVIDKRENPYEVAAKLRNEISTYVEGVKLKGIDGHGVMFVIPCHDTKVNQNCRKMFEHLETNKEMFQIDSMSLSNTTLEDVFLQTQSSYTDSKTGGDKNTEDGKNDGTDLIEVQAKDSSWSLTICALLLKRFHFIKRKLRSYGIPALIAIGFLFLSIFLGQTTTMSSSSGGPPFKMSLKSYGKTLVFFNDTEDVALIKMMHIYRNLVTNENSDFRLVKDVSEAIVIEGTRNLPFYRHHIIAGAEMSLKQTTPDVNIQATVMFNNVAKHSAPISLNLVMNTLAKFTLGDEYAIKYTNHPLDNIDMRTDEQLSEVQIALLWLIILPLGVLFFMGSFIYFPYVELSTSFTQIQLMCGVWPSVYWLTTYLADFTLYMVLTLIMCIFSLIWVPFQGVNEFGAMCLILTLYGVSGIPFSYLFARKKSFTSAYALFIILGIMLGVILTVIVCMLEESGDAYYTHIGGILKTVFLILCPQFGLTYSGVAFSRKAIQNFNFVHMPKLKHLSVCSREEPNPCCYGNGAACDSYRSYLSVLSPDIFYMLIGAMIYLGLNIALHWYWLRQILLKTENTFRTLWSRRKQIDKQKFDGVLVDANEDNKYDTLRVRKLTKSYAGQPVVNGIEFNLKYGECLGLLGVNGAGKTTTFKMLTREEVKDDGSIQINGVGVDQDEYLKKLGYCPQSDALNFSLTGRDILETIAKLRGISQPKEIVNQYLDQFELTEIADLPCGCYSGGNKRKLSFAVAIIGLPSFVLLDEPTTGVDPSSRRRLWGIIKGMKDKKKNSFILTSHSMAECEALCNDVSIMKAGTIKKCGPIAELKQNMNGFSVKFKLRTIMNESVENEEANDEVDGVSMSVLRPKSGEISVETIEELIEYLEKTYDGEVKDKHSGMLHYYIKGRRNEAVTGKQIRWSELFKDFENLKSWSNGFVEDYMVSEASLEDVFLDVAQSNGDVAQSNGDNT